MKEKRRFRRIGPSRRGEVYFPDTAEEALCQLEDISVGGPSLDCKFLRQPGDLAVAYLGEPSRFQGRITAVKKGAFAMSFAQQKRGKLADQLTVAINRHVLNGNVAA